MVTITNHKHIGSDGGYETHEFTGLFFGRPFVVIVCDGQYDYEKSPDFGDDEDDEPIQVAVGEYAEKHEIDLGKVHR